MLKKKHQNLQTDFGEGRREEEVYCQLISLCDWEFSNFTADTAGLQESQSTKQPSSNCFSKYKFVLHWRKFYSFENPLFFLHHYSRWQEEYISFLLPLLYVLVLWTNSRTEYITREWFQSMLSKFFQLILFWDHN